MKMILEDIKACERIWRELEKRIGQVVHDETGYNIASFKRLNIYPSENLITVIVMLTNDETIYRKYSIDQVVDNEDQNEDDTPDIFAGTIVTLKPNARTITGESIPTHSLNTKYVVVRVSPCWITIDDGSDETYAVAKEDLIIV